MKIFDADSFSDLLAKRRPDAPQVILAGWFLPTGEPIGGACIACDETPSEGAVVVAYASALATCITRINELSDVPGQGSKSVRLEATWKLVEMIVGDLAKSQWIKNDLASPRALAGAPADERPLAAEMDRRFRLEELGLSGIIAERERQVDVEKFSPSDDDGYINGELIAAGIAYAQYSDPTGAGECAKDLWPLSDAWWKPSDNPIRNLEKAGAFIAAEIARLLRVEERGPFWIETTWPDGTVSKQPYADLSSAQDCISEMAASPADLDEDADDNFEVPPSVLQARIVGIYGTSFGGLV